MLSQKNLENFMINYFLLNHCKVKRRNPGVFQVKLTEELDKKLMNRPFYWHYMESTNQKGEPLSLTIITDPQQMKSKKGEWLHYGSPRFQQIINHLKESATFTRLFEQVETIQKIPLYPWLILNVKITYQSSFLREELFSVGLNLINGIMKTEMMEKLQKKQFNHQISDYCYSLSPIITLKSGYKRILEVFMNYLHEQEHSWAINAFKQYAYEKQLINNFFKNTEDIEDQKRILKEAKKRHQPKINIEVVNGGVFYLGESFHKQ